MDGSAVTAFLVVDLLLVLTPGADWAYAIAAGLRDRTVLPAVAGLVAGYAGHTVLLAAGVAVLVAAVPSLLTALTVAGAAYLVWLGGSVLVRPGVRTGDVAATIASRSRWRAMVRGLTTSGLNPKGLLLYLALLPRFVDPSAAWPVALQTAVLGVVHMANCAVVYLAVGMLARSLLRTRPGLARLVGRGAGVAMIGVGLALLVERVAA